MKKQFGFTLIELLLVLAIIGIISAIAIPTLLGQRTRSRDKSALANAAAIIPDLVASYDKARDAGKTPLDPASFTTIALGTATAPVTPTYWTARNPWGTPLAGYSAILSETSNLGAITRAAATSATQGQVQIGFMAGAGGNPAVLVTAVYLFNPFIPASGTATNVFSQVINVN